METSELRAARKDVMAAVGHNLLTLQSLEASLKGLIPLIDPEQAAHSLDNLRQRAAKAGKQTLGTLGTRLAGRAALNPDAAGLLDGVIKKRNLLVHHFIGSGHCDLSSVVGCRSAIEWLRGQHVEIRELAVLIDAMLMGTLEIVRETLFAGTEEYEPFKIVCDQFAATRAIALEWRFDPVDERWEATIARDAPQP